MISCSYTVLLTSSLFNSSSTQGEFLNFRSFCFNTSVSDDRCGLAYICDSQLSSALICNLVSLGTSTSRSDNALGGGLEPSPSLHWNQWFKDENPGTIEPLKNPCLIPFHWSLFCLRFFTFEALGRITSVVHNPGALVGSIGVIAGGLSVCCPELSSSSGLLCC